MTTYSMLAPAAGSLFYSRHGTTYTADGFGLVTGVALGDIRDLQASGCAMLGAGTLNDAAAWNAGVGVPQVLAAKGATQGAAVAVTSNRVYLTATASTEGAILKAVATGANTELWAPGGVGVKIYPPVGGKLTNVTSTNEAMVLAKGKGIDIVQRDATNYDVAIKGA